MDPQLTPFEIEILDRVIPTQTLGNPSQLKMAIRNILVGDREKLRSQGVEDNDFSVLLSQTGRNIFDFLKNNEFYYEREGGVFYLTEKGKQLRVQGTYQKYMEWREVQHAKNTREMREIEMQGFVKEDQPEIVKKELEKKRKKFGF